MLKTFSEQSIQSLNGYYVYALIDPRDNQVFYIGKGIGNRVFSHEMESDKSPETEKLKLQTIRMIEEDGFLVKRVIINWGLTESEAFAAEASLINLLNFTLERKLSNMIAGHRVHEGLTVEDFELLYGAEHLTEKDIKHNILVIKINKRYQRTMTAFEVYETVRGIWKASINSIQKRNVQYVFGVYNQLIVAVYKPDEWHYVHEMIDVPRPYELENGVFESVKNRIYFISKDYVNLDENQQFYLHKSRNGSTLLVYGDGASYFPTNELEKALLAELPKEQNRESTYELKIPDGKYQIVESELTKNGLRLISYYPIQEMRKSVTNITRITGISLLIVLLVGFSFMALYYKNILLQLKIITEKLKQVEEGDLSTQITVLPNNEFSYVFEQFNRMVKRIRQLLDTTLKEQELRNQAELRQLQLQIHPHFLYNSLSYIVTVADNPEAVMEMAVHLSNYYRHCTQNKSVATIGEEVSYAKAYLSIMAMRKRIEYDINVAKELYQLKIIPLIIQPLIENAIEHGIEERENAKHIFVKIYQLPNGAIRVEVSDDGDGISEDDKERLMERLQKKQREENESVGLWNVNQRLINYYDESAGLQFGKSIWGGLLVSFTFVPEGEKDDSINR